MGILMQKGIIAGRALGRGRNRKEILMTRTGLALVVVVLAAVGVRAEGIAEYFERRRAGILGRIAGGGRRCRS